MIFYGYLQSGPLITASDFGAGPIGATVTVLALPIVIIFLYRICPTGPPPSCFQSNETQHDPGDCIDKCLRWLNFSQILNMDLLKNLGELVSWEACLLFAG